MKRNVFYLIATVTVAGILVLGCAQAMIENTIDDFEAAVNTPEPEGVDDLRAVLSEDSQLWAARPTSIEEFHAYMYGTYYPISIYGLSIDTDGDMAYVDAKTDYAGLPGLDTYFVMKRHGFFLFPSWKIKEYWDYVGDEDFAWLINRWMVLPDNK